MRIEKKEKSLFKIKIMGTCRSKDAVGEESNKITVTTVLHNNSNNNATSSMLHSMLPMALPVIRQVICRQVIEKGIVLYYEDPVPTDSFRENMSEEDLPFKPIQLEVQDINVVHRDELISDMEQYPDFGWPEKDKVRELMMNNGPEEEVGMVVFDMINVDLRLSLGPGYELVVPVKKFGVKVDLEIGYGGKIDHGSIQFKGPLLRVWYVTDTRKLYLSFLKRPNIIPNFNVNADRGKGDFAFMNFTETSTTLDDVVERVLCDFGPGLKGLSQKGKKKKKDNESSHSWIGEALGGLVVEMIKKKGAKIQPGKPLEIDLNTTIDNQMMVLMGKPRSSTMLRKKIETLKQELTKAEETEAAEKAVAAAMNNIEGNGEKNSTEQQQPSSNFCGMSNIFCGSKLITEEENNGTTNGISRN